MIITKKEKTIWLILMIPLAIVLDVIVHGRFTFWVFVYYFLGTEIAWGLMVWETVDRYRGRKNATL